MPIVTDGLFGYWNSKQGYNGTTWDDLSNNNRVMTMVGTALSSEAVAFDGVDDYGTFNINHTGDYTLEIWFRKNTNTSAHIIGSGNNPRIRTTTNTLQYQDSGGNKTILVISANTTYHTSITYNSTTKVVTGYINNNKIFSSITSGIPSWTTGIIASYDGTQQMLNGSIYSIRLYSRILSSDELTQNYSIGTEVGLSAIPPSSPPIVLSVVANKQKISDEPTMNQSIITVQFDKAVTQYVARLNGVDYNTGTLVHTGGAVAANTDAQVVIDWNELTTEGSNRINVYGQNANGWTVQ